MHHPENDWGSQWRGGNGPTNGRAYTTRTHSTAPVVYHIPHPMDEHRKVEGLTTQAMIEAHKDELEIQEKYEVHYHKY